MRIITWNCNGAFRKKYEHLIPYNDDLLIIQKCENPEYIQDLKFKNLANNFLCSPTSDPLAN